MKVKLRIGLLAVAGILSVGIPSGSFAVDGKVIFNKSCKMCHGTGIAGAPKLGDKPAWKDRIASGTPVLEQHAIKGFKGKKGFMPPKGGAVYLSDDQIKAAVAFMIDEAK